jgi:hypothetical protein
MLVGISACSSEDLKRTGFETLQNVQERDCPQDLTSSCPRRGSYEKYQEQRRRLEARGS